MSPGVPGPPWGRAGWLRGGLRVGGKGVFSWSTVGDHVGQPSNPPFNLGAGLVVICVLALARLAVHLSLGGAQAVAVRDELHLGHAEAGPAAIIHIGLSGLIRIIGEVSCSETTWR